jgi:iodotyrosine deiodinase
MSDGPSDGALLRLVRGRRSVRRFGNDPVPRQAIARILEAGRHSPSGANRQPWRYIVIDDPAVKQAIRIECERAEDVFHRNAPAGLTFWMKAHGITPQKPFLEVAPYLIAVFYKTREPYAVPSVWVSIAFMLLQVEQEGLGATIYTPAGARLNSILLTPDEFQLAAILPIGIPADHKRQERRSLSQTAFLNRFGDVLTT